MASSEDVLSNAQRVGLGKDPRSSGISCVQRAGKAILEVGRQHPTGVAQDCQDGRLTSASQKGATGQQGAQSGYKLIQYAPSAASGCNPHPRDQAMSPALSTRRSRLSLTQPLGQGWQDQRRLSSLQGEPPLAWHGCPARRRCELHPTAS